MSPQINCQHLEKMDYIFVCPQCLVFADNDQKSIQHDGMGRALDQESGDL